MGNTMGRENPGQGAPPLHQVPRGFTLDQMIRPSNLLALAAGAEQ